MAAKCKKCDPHEICEECPEWIFTLADLIMCMMGLFVLLWVLKPEGKPATEAAAAAAQQPSQREVEVMGEIRKAFGYIPDPNSSDPIDQYLIQPQKPRLVGEGEKGTQEEHEEAAEGTDPKVQSVREGATSPVGARVNFDAGDAKLSAGDERTLNQIAKQIVGSRNVVIIKGHAARDDFADGGTPERFMDISVKRAQAAADYLVGRGVSPDVLRVQGCATFEPVNQKAYTAEAHRGNRRVEVLSTDKVVRDLADPNEKAAAPLD